MSTSKTKKTVWFGMKLTPKQKEKIKTLARRHGVSQKRAVLDLIEKEVPDEPIQAKSGSFLDLNRDLYGVGSGPADGSTNPEHMKGYGQ